MGSDENVDHRAVGASSTGATIAGAFKTQGWPRLMTAVAVYAWNKAATPVINDDGVRRASSGNASVSCFDRANGGKVPWSARSCSTESRMTRMERELMKNGMTSRMAAGAFVVALAVSACANDDDGNTNLDPDTDGSMTDGSMTDDSMTDDSMTDDSMTDDSR